MTIDPQKIPFIYGTAWKEDRTEMLCTEALGAGFRAFDTANQRKHYYEAGLGAALKVAYKSGVVTREDLFLQSKFTFQRGQDHRLPYNPKDPLSLQVQQSFQSSLDHLHATYLDSYVLHGPSTGKGLHDADREVWRAMETLHERKLVHHLGLSNVSAEQLTEFLNYADVKPMFVQNRCYAITGWDYHVRKICYEHGLVYQGFSLLTANPEALSSPLVKQLASDNRAHPTQVIFRFAQQMDMCPLTGTSNRLHMEADLQCNQFSLAEEELMLMERVALATTPSL